MECYTKCQQQSNTEAKFRWAGPDLNRRPSPCESSVSIDWDAFDKWVRQRYATKTAINLKIYGRRFIYILSDPAKASDLLALTPYLRNHAMRGLAAISKFLGCYGEWQQIKNRVGLKWRENRSDELIRDLLGGNVVEEVSAWLREAERLLPQRCFKALRFILYTGLRPDEGCKAINLLNTDPEYLDRANMILQHFKYPKVFLRRSKNAYITFITDDMLQWAKEAAPITYNTLLQVCKRRRLPCKMKLLRKVWATVMRESGLAPEVIDLLQGRIPSSVFVKHYYRPDLLGEVRKKVLEGLKRLP